MEDRLGVHDALESAALFAQGRLVAAEVIDVGDLGPRVDAALGRLPGSVPLDRPVNLPVRPDKVESEVFCFVGFEVVLEAMSNLGDAEIQ